MFHMYYLQIGYMSTYVLEAKITRGGGGQLPLKGGHHARTKKRVKRVVFHGRAMYARTVERVSKLPKSGKKDILFNSFDTRLGNIFY